MLAFVALFAVLAIFVNYLLLHFPGIIAFLNGSNSKLKREKRVLGKGSGCLHISHRGGSNEFPENTILAFDNSIRRCNTDMLETDVWLTKDNVLVVLHDENLFHICGVDKCVGEYNYNELPLIKDSNNLEPSCDYLDRAKWSCYKEEFESQKIVTLEELFQRYPNMLISVDIKNPNSRYAVERTIELVRMYKREGRTILGSFSDENIEFIKQINRSSGEELIVFVGKRKLFVILISYFIGILPWLYIEEHVFSFPLSFVYFSNCSRALINKMPESKIVNISRDYLDCMVNSALLWLFTRKTLIEHLQKRGIRCFAWVCNGIEEFKICTELGLDGIMTDEPTLLREYYNKMEIKPFK